jgi:thiol-disulfide isomerase/thioredoxin
VIRSLRALLAVPLLAAGCAATPEPPVDAAAAPPFADCGALTAPPAGAGREASTPTNQLPDLELPCFTGGAAVRLRTLRGPAVINLWASWCAPCRNELPAFQRLAERTGGRLHVVGVNTRDRDAAAQSLATDLGLSFPTLVDPDEELRVAVKRPALPVTVFVAASGRVRYIHDSAALDDRALADLVGRHLDVRVLP